MTDPFKVLGLKRATATQADVKAAYARLLKVTRPEEDRAAFMALREAFESARQAAKYNDQDREAATRDAKSADAQVPQTSVAPPPLPQVPTQWHHDAELDWHFDTSPSGKLVERTVKWMVADGQDRTTFSAKMSEDLIELTDAQRVAFRNGVIEYIMVAADPDAQRHQLEVWKPLDGTRPDWMNADVTIALRDDLDLLRSRPQDAYGARNYNTVLGLLTRETRTFHIPPIDVVTVFEAQETAALKDNYGSYFDRDTKRWIDMSPVSVAMRDLQAAFDRNMWDITETCRTILRRDDLQSLDEFQDLDARLRQLIANATGFQTEARHPVEPAWLRRSLLNLFDNHFGWTRHFGRHPWERQQYDWLHRLVDPSSARGPEANWIAQQPPPQKPGASTTLFGWLLDRPRNLLIGCFGFRVLQVLWRLVT